MFRLLAMLAFSGAVFAQTPSVTAVVNGGNYLPQLSPGILATIYGTNFGSNGASVTVTAGGRPCFVYPSTVTPTQLAVELPTELSAGATTLVVAVNGVQSAPFSITLATYAPTILTQNQLGSGLGSVFTSANKPVTLAAPAHPGDALYFFAIGLGPTNPLTPTGPATAANPTASPVTLTVGGMPTKIAYAGVTSGSAGVYQVNFTVPSGLQGTVPIVISIAGASSSTGVTLALPGLSAIVNSGSFASPGVASPGSIVTVFANSLGTSTDQLSGVFPATKAQGVQVTFNGTPAPIFNLVASSAQQQINLLVPSELPTSGTVNVQLTTSTAFYPTYTLNMVPANPGFYRIADPQVPTRLNVIAQFANTTWLALPTSTTAALGLPACSVGTSTLSTCGQPATNGDYLVLYATGLGLATPNGDPNGKPLATGSIPPVDGSVLYQTPTTPVVTVGGVPAKVVFSGLAPGAPGEYQIDIQVPSGVASGDDVPLQLTILGASDTATISIQPRP